MNLRLLQSKKTIVPVIVKEKPEHLYFKITCGYSVYLKNSYLYQFGRYDYEHIHSWFDTLNDVILNLEYIGEQENLAFTSTLARQNGKTDSMLLFYNSKYERYFLCYKRHILGQYPQYFDNNDKIF